MAGVVHIPWYATLFRGDVLAEAVSEVAAASIRYGATQYRVHRSRDDAYRITQMVWFESRLEWERYWEGPEMVAFRANYSGRYQVPVLYVWQDEIAEDMIAAAAESQIATPAETPAA
jgi:hypothetical protein